MQVRVILIILIIFCFPVKAVSKKIEIILKVDDKIITNVDVLEETSYLKLLNPKLKNINQQDLYDIAKSSLTREVIKKKELKKVLDINANYNLKNNIEKKLLNILSAKSIDDLKFKISNNGLRYEDVFTKLKIESLWNMYIFERFNKRLNIDEEYLTRQIKKQKENIKPKFEYYLYEILFEIDEKSNLEKKLKLIKESIDKNGFKNAANIYSVADSSKFGGEIGWVKETQVSENILTIIKDLKENEISRYLDTPGGYLILKFSEKKKIIEEFNEEKNFQLLKRYVTNRQLNQFSLIHYKRLKKNTTIKEYN